MSSISQTLKMLLCFFILLSGYNSAVLAELPTTINYQGYLTNSSGIPLNTNGTPLDITFRLYTSDMGGSSQWDETQAVEVTKGLFSVELFSVNTNPLDGLFNTPLFLGIQVGSDDEMLPRRPITLTAFSVKAYDSLTVDGHTSAELDQAAHLFEFDNPHHVTAAQTGAVDATDLAEHAANTSAHHARYSDNEAINAIKDADGTGSGLDADLLDGQHATAFATSLHNHDVSYYTKTETYTKDQVDSLLNAALTRITELEEKLASVSLITVNDQPTVRFTGVNVQIVNGLNNTQTENGSGNLIVGYDEPSTSPFYYCTLGTNPGTQVSIFDEASCLAAGGIWSKNFKTGSHFIVTGSQNNYSRWGGVVFGFQNTSNYNFATVTGGSTNNASGYAASVQGGGRNRAYGNHASMSGGRSNAATGEFSSISGGQSNVASGYHASVIGGGRNIASGSYASIVGGGGLTSDEGNLAVANYSVILGGLSNLAGDGYCVIKQPGDVAQCYAGSDPAIGVHATVAGGTGNQANGVHAAVGGGYRNNASGLDSSVSGGRTSSATGDHASVSGGSGNQASGYAASVSGGASAEASGDYASVSGGRWGSASGNYASVSGGGTGTQDGRNIADEEYSSVLGGIGQNTTYATQTIPALP